MKASEDANRKLDDLRTTLGGIAGQIEQLEADTLALRSNFS